MRVWRDFTRHGLLSEAASDVAVEEDPHQTRLADAAGADLVIEAVTEDLPLKLELFVELDRICQPPTVLASSSGAPASDVSRNVKHRERVIATHSGIRRSSSRWSRCAAPEDVDDVLAWVCDALRASGKEPAVIDREIAGFIGNRLQFALLREAWALGVGRRERRGDRRRRPQLFGRRLGITGPIESADIVLSAR